MSIEVCRNDFVNQFKMEMAALKTEEVAEFESFFAQALKETKEAKGIAEPKPEPKKEEQPPA